MNDIICIYHDPCVDGFTSAWVAHRALEENTLLYPASHGKPPPDVKNKHVLIVDYCYPAAVLASMAKDAASILVLDHHISAQKELIGIRPPIDTTSADNWQHHIADITASESSDNTRALFDTQRSGAGITYDYFFSKESRPLLVDYVEDRDLWRFTMPESRAISEFIFIHNHTIDEWNHLSEALEQRFDECVSIGNALLKRKHKDLEEMLNLCATTETIAGYKNIPVVNAPNIMGSDAAHALSARYPEAPFTAYYYDVPGQRKYGLRSQADGADVSKIAVSMGGGGHKHAAGFSVKRS